MFKLRLANTAADSMVTNIVLLTVGGLVLAAVSLVLMTSDGCSGDVGLNRLAHPEAFHNFQQFGGEDANPPGSVVMELTFEGSETAQEVRTPEQVAEARKAAFGDPPAPASVEMEFAEREQIAQRMREEVLYRASNISDRAESEISLYTKLTAPRLLSVRPDVKADSYGNASLALDLKREFKTASRTPLPEPWKGTREDGPFYEPIQMESSWFAFENVIEGVRELTPDQIAGASNGTHPLALQTPEVIKAMRGHVFDAHGVLWSLRKQPLRNGSYEYQGKSYDHAWYGVIAFLREGQLAGEKDWVHQSLAFTTLTLPQELEQYAQDPGELSGNDDPLAQGKVGVKLSGLFFRQILYYEPIAELEVSDITKTEGSLERTYWAEDQLPWLVAPAIEVSDPPAWPASEDAREMLRLYSESAAADGKLNRDTTRNRFDEPGYYLLLRSLQGQSSPFDDLPEAELNYRKLLTRSERNRYRGAKAGVNGLLQAEYRPVILPPNIAGRRHLYRTYVLDTLESNQIDNSQQWYVDVLEPPTSFRGLAPVRVEGRYYRNDEFLVEEDGRKVLRSYPLLLTDKLLARRDEISAEERSINFLALWITMGVGGVLVIGLILLGRRDRKKRDVFEAQTMNLVRSQLKRAKGKPGASKKAAAKPGDADMEAQSDADTEAGDDSRDEQGGEA